MSRLSALATSALFLFLLSLNSVAGSLLFAVNEGTSSSTDAIFMKTKYAPLVDYLAAASGDKIVLETPKVLSIVTRNLERKRYDILLVRPSHLSARAMRDHGYRLLAVATGDAQMHFIVRGDSKMKSLSDIQGHSIAMPDPLAYPTNLALALLRDEGLNGSLKNIQYMDRQDAVGMVVESGIRDVGVVMSYSKVSEEWLEKGGRFLYSKSKLPFWSVIVSSNVTPQKAERLKRALLALNNTPNSRAMLGNLNIAGFSEGKQKAYLDMLDWVEGRRRERVANLM